MPAMWNGTTPAQAVPPKVSISTESGTRGRSASAGTGQCMNSRSFQVCRKNQGRDGSG